MTATAVATRPMQTAPSNGDNRQPVKYEPMRPVGSALSLKTLLTANSAALREALPKHVTSERLIKTMLVAANRTPDLLQCTQASILETISRAAELGLDLSGTLGEAYPVPFNNRVGDNWVKQCQLIIGYRGLAKLARQSGEIKRIDADVVCANDKFTFRKGSNGALDFEPHLTDRGEPIGAFAFAEFKDGGQQYDFMPVEDIEKIRRRSKAGSDKQGNAIGPWKTDWPEMAKKTVFRRLAKWLPLSAEKFNAAIESDSELYTDMTEVLEVAPTLRSEQLAASATQRLTERLKSQQQEVVEQPAAITHDDQPTIDVAPTESEQPIAADQPPAEPQADAQDAAPGPGHKYQGLIDQLSEAASCPGDVAERALGVAAKSLWGKTLESITVKQARDLEFKIKQRQIQIGE